MRDPSLEGIQVWVCPDGQLQPPGAPLPSNAPKSEKAMSMRELLLRPTGKALYLLRKAIVEPVFGQIKKRGLCAALATFSAIGLLGEARELPKNPRENFA